MPILNYTTQIAVEKTVGEIQAMLAKAKASAVLSEFDSEGVIHAVSFRITTSAGVMSFRLPCNVDAMHKIIQREGKLPSRLRTREQAARIGWRVVKDWLAAQLALVAAGMADVEQVFLPYWQVSPERTIYEALMERGFSGQLLLSEPLESLR